jgi:endonuclease/exonuclease/phosphatase (EEP) superfamily protein YafD
LSGQHRHRVGRALTTAVAVLALVFSTVALIARTQPVSSIPRLVLAVGSTFVPLAALVGLVLAVVARRRILAIFGVFIFTATLAIQANWYVVSNPKNLAGPVAEIRVLSSNLRFGRAEPAGFVELARENADVITVAELTPEAIERFNAAGIGESFPYSQLIPGPGAGGIGIWSRYPLTEVTAPRRRSVSMPGARIEVPGVELKPLVASVHIQSPVSDNNNTVEAWSYGMAGAKAQLDNFAREAGPAAVIIGGDYNSTPDMRQFRDLLTNGYRDAVEQLGAGYAPTFRANADIPPIITIDHILTRNAAAKSIKTITVEGSDHRALLATIAVPLTPAA